MTDPAEQRPAGPQAAIEKIMTLSQSEFANSIAAFAGVEAGAAARRGDTVALPCGSGTATITCEPIEGFSFGGLVPMPRARVVLSFDNASEGDIAAFLRRFDIAFQRGGG